MPRDPKELPKELARLIDPTELARLIDEGHVAKAFPIASLIRPFAGRGGTQKYFGGDLHLKVVNVEFPDEHVRLRQAWDEKKFLNIIGRGKHHESLWYDGPAYVTFEVHYITNQEARDNIVFRKRIPTREHARFYKVDANMFFSWDRAEDFEKSLGHSLSDGVKVGFNATGFIKSQWAGLREDLFRKEPSWIDEKPGPVTADQVEKAITDRLNFEVFKIENDQKEAMGLGLRRPGELIREIMGCQWLMYRYVQLALPESMNDAELIALLVGEEAAWGGTAVMKHFDLANPNERKALVRKVGDHYEVPLTQNMRAQTLRLQAKFAELIDRRRAEAEQKEFVRHPAVEGMLLKYALAARRMGIDLKEELKGLGVTAQDHWACRRLEQYAKALPEIDK